MTPDKVWTFWKQAGPGRWFTKDAAFDGALRARFGTALAEARTGAFDHWGETPEGAAEVANEAVLVFRVADLGDVGCAQAVGRLELALEVGIQPLGDDHGGADAAQGVGQLEEP